MNMQDLIDAIHAENSNLKKTDILSVLKLQGDIAKNHLIVAGAELTLPGIGKLKAVRREAMAGRNPATGEAIDIPAKIAVKFTAAKALKDAVA